MMRVHFLQHFTMPDVREHEEPQRLAVVEILSRTITGLSDTSHETLELILVTILMALMASTPRFDSSHTSILPRS